MTFKIGAVTDKGKTISQLFGRVIYAILTIGKEIITARKLRTMQCHESQHPPFLGCSEEEAEKLACHEYFTLVKPPSRSPEMTDLFSALRTIHNQG